MHIPQTHRGKTPDKSPHLLLKYRRDTFPAKSDKGNASILDATDNKITSLTRFKPLKQKPESHRITAEAASWNDLSWNKKWVTTPSQLSYQLYSGTKPDHRRKSKLKWIYFFFLLNQGCILLYHCTILLSIRKRCRGIIPMPIPLCMRHYTYAWLTKAPKCNHRCHRASLLPTTPRDTRNYSRVDDHRAPFGLKNNSTHATFPCKPFGKCIKHYRWIPSKKPRICNKTRLASAAPIQSPDPNKSLQNVHWVNPGAVTLQNPTEQRSLPWSLLSSGCPQ